MNKSNAKVIAETITRDQLEAMFQTAKESIGDWSAASSVNPSMSLGKVWNIMYPLFLANRPLQPAITTNMVWAFGDYLEVSLKPAKKKRPAPPSVYHEEPNFEVDL